MTVWSTDFAKALEHGGLVASGVPVEEAVTLKPSEIVKQKRLRLTDPGIFWLRPDRGGAVVRALLQKRTGVIPQRCQGMRATSVWDHRLFFEEEDGMADYSTTRIRMWI